MFNTYHAGNQSYSSSTKINAVTGAILKNHPKSWFEKFHLDSERAKKLMAEGGYKGHKNEYSWTDSRGYEYYRDVENPENAITVLQMVICGDMEVIAECVYTKDYEESVIKESI